MKKMKIYYIYKKSQIGLWYQKWVFRRITKHDSMYLRQ